MAARGVSTNTVKDWNRLGYSIRRGSKAKLFDRHKVALFTKDQVYKVQERVTVGRSYDTERGCSSMAGEGYSYEGSMEEALGGDFY